MRLWRLVNRDSVAGLRYWWTEFVVVLIVIELNLSRFVTPSWRERGERESSEFGQGRRKLGRDELSALAESEQGV